MSSLCVQLAACDESASSRSLPARARGPTAETLSVSMPPPGREWMLASPDVQSDDSAVEDFRTPNVLIYIVDTLRADHLGVYGNESIRTPHFDRLAESGVVFQNTYANSSWTRPSVASILTGLYPTRHAANTRAASLPQDIETLGEVLSKAGWETALITANPNVGSAFGFSQGFDSMVEMYARRDPGTVDERELVTPSDVITRRALGWIDQTAQPFFLVCLSIDPHQPLRPPARFDLYGHGSLNFREVVLKARQGGMTHTLFQRVLALYKATVSFSDDSFGGLMRGLKERGIEKDTLVVLTADHGEEFGEYGRVGHGLSLSDPAIRVPLIMSWHNSKEIAPGTRIDATAELVDVAPSVLDLLGLARLPEMDGQSLFAATPVKPALSTLRLANRNLQAAISRQWKLVDNVSTGEVALFDLGEGEASEANGVDAKKARKRLERALLALGEERPISLARPESELPAHTQEALRVLGYME